MKEAAEPGQTKVWNRLGVLKVLREITEEGALMTTAVVPDITSVGMIVACTNRLGAPVM